MNKFIIVLLIVVIGLGVFAFVSRNAGQKVALNFEESGVIVKDNPGFEPNVWHLIYEKPGAPALNVKLSFDGNSKCIEGQFEEICYSNLFRSGDKVVVQGSKREDTVLVSSLEIKESVPLQTVILYYYDSEQDKDASGNIMCSRQGLVPVERQIPVSNTPIQDAVNLLLLGPTPQEKNQGITTEYPLEGLSLEAASLKDGVLTLTFDDPNNRTGGGSCRVGILWFQIEETAKQFPGVTQVRFSPEWLFQP